MKRRTLPLYTKTALIVSALGGGLLITFVLLATWSTDRYHQEVTQALHRDLARYVLDHLPAPLFKQSGSTWQVDAKVLKSIALNTMMINPGVEVYLVGLDGEILGHALPDSDVAPERIDPEPLLQFISGNNKGPVFASNPRMPSRRAIFSAAPVESGGQAKAYLYIVLASHQALTLAEQMQASHVARLSLGASAGLIALFSLTALFAFRRITRPVRKLSEAMQHYREQEFRSEINDHTESDTGGNEVLALRQSFELMQERIRKQFEQLGESDRLRRELVSNISHDLRTPLAAMQGYLETLLLKSSELDAEQQLQYLKVAHRHSKRLGEMVAQLFELSKLDAGRVTPNLEIFSLSELLHDIKQDYELAARQRHLSLNIDGPEENLLVHADISLIQRVLQNLIDNAIQHTPRHGSVVLELVANETLIQVHIRDSGSGIAASEINHVFERYFQSARGAQSARGLQSALGAQSASRAQSAHSATNVSERGAGLGLNIVKKILELHGSHIKVESPPNQGACFSFSLPRPEWPLSSWHLQPNPTQS